jgi:hypothetical protein
MDYLFEKISVADLKEIIDFEGENELYVVMVTTPSCPKCNAIKARAVELGRIPDGIGVDKIALFEFDGSPEAGALLSSLNLSHAPSFIAVNTEKKSYFVNESIETYEDLEDNVPIFR